MSAFTKAFWISPDGKSYKVPQTHIKFVLNHPELFQADLDKYETLVNKYNESWGDENKARIDFLKDIVKEGWVRVRFRKKGYLYVLETWQWNQEDIDDRIRPWAKQVNERAEIYPGTDFKFLETKTGKSWKVDSYDFILGEQK